MTEKWECVHWGNSELKLVSCFSSLLFNKQSTLLNPTVLGQSMSHRLPDTRHLINSSRRHDVFCFHLTNEIYPNVYPHSGVELTIHYPKNQVAQKHWQVWPRNKNRKQNKTKKLYKCRAQPMGCKL